MENIDYFKNKKTKILETISPVCMAYNIFDYEYIIENEGKKEILRIGNDYIGCTGNSIEAVVDELTGWIFAKIYCKNRYIGAFKTQTLNVIKRYWIKNYKGEK